MKFVEKVLTAVLVGLSLVGGRTAGGQEAVIHSFSGGDGYGPNERLLIDAKGDIFGTTNQGGTYGNGTAFELSPIAGGGWKETVIHDFDYADGEPVGALVIDAKGNLYGMTGFANGDNYDGVVFELSPTTSGSWKETTIHSFPSSATDGSYPYGTLTFDARGNLYGTTSSGGSNDLEFGSGDGTVFELTPSADGTWTENVVYDFGATYANGIDPVPSVTIDSAGNLYGTTSAGGSRQSGVAFELTPASDGGWTEKVLYNFGVAGSIYGQDSTLILDGHGNIYGTTYDQPNGTFGTVFELSPVAAGPWTTKVFDFTDGALGAYPYGGLTLDTMGNLYGTTGYGGAYDTQGSGSVPSGTVFKLTPQSNGGWTETVLHSFPATQYDGYGPVTSVILDPKGNLYGTTALGGAYNRGTVFEIEANAAPVGTTTTLVANPSTNLVAGEPITLTATVTPASGSAIPTGNVIFADPDIPGAFAVRPLEAGVAVYKGTVPPMGTYSVSSTYDGAPGFLGSNSATITSTVTAPTPK